MKRRMSLLFASLSVFGAASPVAACGEGIYAMRPDGQAAGYLAPRPAVVLVFDDRQVVPESTRAVYRGMVRAGHSLEVARSGEQLAAALEARRYDVIIARVDAFDRNDGLRGLEGTSSLLPVVPKGEPAPPAERFRARLTQGAGLVHYLRLIDRLMKERR